MMKSVLKHGGLAAAVICFTMTAQAQIGIFTQSQDIGDVGAAGSAKLENDEYIVEGSGADIWGTADGLHFLYKEITGAFTIKGQVYAEVGGGDATWTKAGLMVRDSLDPGSAFGFAMIRSSGQDFAPQWRDTAGAEAAWGEDASLVGGIDGTGVQDGHVEVERLGTTLNFYYVDLATGQRVLHMTHVVPDLKDPVYVGLAVTSHSAGQISTGYFQNVVLQEYPWSAVRNLPVQSYSLGQTIQGIELKVDVREGQTVANLTVKEKVPADLAVSNVTSSAGDATLANGEITWTLANVSGSASLAYDLQAPTIKGYGDIVFSGEATDGTLTIPLAQTVPLRTFNIYETFSYPAQQSGAALAGLTGGLGWASAWADSGAKSPNALDAKILEAGLVQNQPAAQNPGGYSLKVTGDADNGVGRKITPVATGELWLSFVFLEEGPAANHWSGLTLFASDGTESSFIGKPYNAEKAGIGNLPGDDSLTQADYKVANHYLVRFVLNGGAGQNDSVYLWINPDESDHMDTFDAGGPNNDEIKDIAEIRLRRGTATGSAYFDTIWMSSDPALPPAGAGRVDLTFNDPNRDPGLPVWDVISIDQYEDGITGEPGFGHDTGNDYYLIVAGYLYYNAAGDAFVANGLPPDRMSGLNGHILGPYNNAIEELGLKNSIKFMNNDAQRGPFTFNVVPKGQYSELRSAMTVGNGYGVLKCTLNYEDGTSELAEIHADDWFRDPGDAAWMWDDVTLLINGMDRLEGGSSTFADSNDPAVNEDATPVNPDKVLVSVTLELDLEKSQGGGAVAYNLYDIWCYPAGAPTAVSDWSLF